MLIGIFGADTAIYDDTGVMSEHLEALSSYRCHKYETIKPEGGKKLSLPTEYTGNLTEALNYICHDKKNDGGVLSVIFVDRVGSYRIEKITVSDFSDLVKRKI